jgi:hypothetical protein
MPQPWQILVCDKYCDFVSSIVFQIHNPVAFQILLFYKYEICQMPLFHKYCYFINPVVLQKLLCPSLHSPLDTLSLSRSCFSDWFSGVVVTHLPGSFHFFSSSFLRFLLSPLNLSRARDHPQLISQPIHNHNNFDRHDLKVSG